MQKLVIGFNQAGRPGSRFLRRQQRHRGIGRQIIGERNQCINQGRSKRFHALNRHALGDFGEHRGEVRELVGHLPSPIGNCRGDDDFTRRVNCDVFQAAVKTALVSNRKLANLFEFIAKKLKAHGMFGGGRKNVDYASAHRKLATLGHHVHPVIGDLDEL